MAEHRRPKREWSRRQLVKSFAGGAMASQLGTSMAWSEPAASGPSPDLAAALRPVWQLSRPKPALPNSYFWTWDHSTNWMLDDPGVLNFGCENRYLKHPDTFTEDYRRLTDLAAGLGIKGVLIWGFLRDAHGGIDAAKRVADYAASRGVAIMPGIGTNYYGGVYYEGRHPYNLETFLEKHGDARMIGDDGQPRPRGLCPSHPAFVEWLQEGVQWLFREFSIGGANLENGDFLVCHCPRCKKRREGWPEGEPEFWQHQFLGYDPALQALQGHLKSRLVTWATYSAFLPAAMKCERPALLDKLPADSICQWTLTGMVHQKALPLTTYLDDGAPESALSGWPKGLKPPAPRNVGFIHQGSQWYNPPRYENVISTIKEGCLRAYRCGLEGVAIHGEVSSMHVPWALNYLAFSHFVHWPEDSLREFGRKTLGPVLGNLDDGQLYVEYLAHWDAGTLKPEQKEDLKKRASRLQQSVTGGHGLGAWRFWHWLAAVSDGRQDRHTVGFF